MSPSAVKRWRTWTVDRMNVETSTGPDVTRAPFQFYVFKHYGFYLRIPEDRAQFSVHYGNRKDLNCERQSAR